MKFVTSIPRLLAILVKSGRITTTPAVNVVKVRIMANGIGVSFPKGDWGNGLSTIVSWKAIALAWQDEESAKAADCKVEIKNVKNNTYSVTSRRVEGARYVVQLSNQGHSCTCPKSHAGGYGEGERYFLQAWKKVCTHPVPFPCHHIFAAYKFHQRLQGMTLQQVQEEAKHARSSHSISEFADMLALQLSWEVQENVAPENSFIPILWGWLKQCNETLATAAFKSLDSDVKRQINARSNVFLVHNGLTKNDGEKITRLIQDRYMEGIKLQIAATLS